MLKGVHRQIVEVVQTEDPFFERALLFVRADCAEDEDADWQERAQVFIGRAVPYTGLRRARLRTRLRVALYTVAGTVLGVLIGVFLVQLP